MRLRSGFFGEFLVLVLVVANCAGLFYIAVKFIAADAYASRNNGALNMVEAAYLTALWAAITAKICFGIFLNVILGIGIFLSRQIDDGQDTQRHAELLAVLKEPRREGAISPLRTGT